MDAVDVSGYFQERYYDEKFIDFLQWNSENGKRTIYTLNTYNDDTVLELYNAVMQLRTVVLPEMRSLKNVNPKRRKRRTVQVLVKVHETLERELKLLVRLIDRKPLMNWLLYPLFTVARSLYSNAKKFEDGTAYVESCGRAVHRCFTMCLQDKNEENWRLNKRQGVYFFVVLEFQIYHRLHNYDMIKNLVKAVETHQRMGQIPSPRDSMLSMFRALMVTYHYYMGLYFCSQTVQYDKAYEFLLLSYLDCPAATPTTRGPQETKILRLLFPCALVSRRLVLKRRDPFQDALIRTINRGDIPGFKTLVQANELQLLREGTYLPTSKLVHLVNLQYVKRAVEQRTGGGTQVPLQTVPQLTECDIALLISSGSIKGYLSHGHACLVLSKTNAFPPLQRR
ncbi:uncharacterized protein KNAG_0D01500 [Huiozyma naganishii CBS 8797]|uniref:PCI domain-containing protein n=1 Tax=Huiozyma naganishii (strain ATCC MYA-139 / BCRC 22969 / CBS 8797 / KCTC 17520 / NBRC 10181 / NCYC 3082 / Yp74L-3) TaxID=1071383 RepID=J7RXS1_HUIN7|nr:hypothetical protein KNAG_0D01500 [Kazachstania naganishii CBS 8797]CCK69902.1 hypothetical protein KNAG_0D01500 [Kazachstania naganishii CBS 8797]